MAADPAWARLTCQDAPPATGAAAVWRRIDSFQNRSDCRRLAVAPFGTDGLSASLYNVLIPAMLLAHTAKRTLVRAPPSEIAPTCSHHLCHDIPLFEEAYPLLQNLSSRCDGAARELLRGSSSEEDWLSLDTYRGNASQTPLLRIGWWDPRGRGAALFKYRRAVQHDATAQTAAALYALRLSEAAATEVRAALRRSLPDDFSPARSVSVPIRMSDAPRHKRNVGFEDYMRRAKQLRESDPGLRDVALPARGCAKRRRDLLVRRSYSRPNQTQRQGDIDVHAASSGSSGTSSVARA